MIMHEPYYISNSFKHWKYLEFRLKSSRRCIGCSKSIGFDKHLLVFQKRSRFLPFAVKTLGVCRPSARRLVSSFRCAQEWGLRRTRAAITRALWWRSSKETPHVSFRRSPALPPKGLSAWPESQRCRREFRGPIFRLGLCIIYGIGAQSRD